MPKSVCNNCRHFNAWNALQGECRRFPPLAGETNFNPKGEPRVPIVPASFWCGEHHQVSSLPPIGDDERAI